MNRELMQDVKNFNFLDKLKIGSYLDAVDEKRWKVGQLVDYKSYAHRHTITVRFDGHTSKWNEIYDLPSSQKIAPFRRYTLPYTGPQIINRQIFRDSPNMNFEEPLGHLKKINHVEKIKPELVNQVYRGQIFILLDNILTRKAVLSKEDYQNVKTLIGSYIHTGFKVLKYALDNINDISSQGIVDPNVIYVSTPHALIHSLPEFLFTFNSLINTSESNKRIKFFVNNVGSMNGKDLRKQLKKEMIDSKVIEMCEQIMIYQNPPYRSFHWSIKKQVLILLSALKGKEGFPKINDVREITDLLDYLIYMHQKQAFSLQTTENQEMELIIKLITLGNFEGKLRGLNEMKKIIENNFKKSRLIKEHIYKNNLLDYLTDNSSFNSELFKRSLPIFEFSEKHDLLFPEIMTRIINLHRDKHQLQLKSFYTTLAQFGKFLEENKVISFFDSIKQFPIEEHWITLIRDYTLGVLEQHYVFKKKFMTPQTGLGLTCLWEIIENKKDQISQVLMDRAIMAFSKISASTFYKKQMEKYVLAAIYGIKEKKNMDAYFKIIHECLKNNREFSKIIQKFDYEMNIIEILVNSVIGSDKLSSKAMENMFELLEEANHFARKKITVNHIKLLWDIPDCRNFLLKFMRKYRKHPNAQEKSTDKILAKQLSRQEIHQIIAHIFLNLQLMNNYTDISEATFQTADELIVCLNHGFKTIDYNFKHTIRCERPSDMLCLNFYTNVVMNAKNEVMVDKCLKRFIEFYIRPVSYYKSLNSKPTDKISSWTLCMRELSKLKDKKFRAYQLFLEEIKGRMVSLTIQQTLMTNLTVLNKVTKEKKTISLPRNTSLWKLRLAINEEFKLNQTNFEMFYPARNNSFEMQKEEDFSLAYVQIPKDPSIPPVVINPSNEKHSHFLKIDEFKRIFAAQFAETIYEEMNKESLENQKIILNILLSVSPIKSLQKKMSNLDINSWEQILDVNSKVKLSYQLSILNKVKSQGVQWAFDFIKNKGIQYLQKMFLTRSKANCSLFEYQTFTELMGLFNEMLKFYKMNNKVLPFSEPLVIEILKPGNYQSPEMIKYLHATLGLLKQIVNYEHIDIRKILQSKSMEELLEVFLLRNEKIQMSNRLPDLLSVCQKMKCMDILEKYMSNWTSFGLLKKYRNSCRLFFNLLVMMIEKDRKDFLNKVREFITIVRQDKQIWEESQNKCDQLLYGWLKVINCLVGSKKGNLVKIFHQSEDKFALYLINEGLFNSVHRLQSSESRIMAFTVLSNLNCKNQILQMISAIIQPMMKKGSWRKQFQWSVKSYIRRKPGSYVGIKNLAATCYINSLLQQLFYIRHFSQPLLALPTRQIDDSENVAYELQKIFAHLKHSDNDVYTTEGLCRTFILDGQPIDPRIQTDVDEFFHALMDKLERNFMKIEKKEIIDDIFRGQYSNMVIGQECPHRSQRVEHFLSIRLQIINRVSLKEALDDFIKGEILEGDNAYFCEKCDKKVKALKRVCVKTLPDILILTLKRFQFDFDTMEKFKLNTYCEFPLELDMSPFTKQALENQDTVLKKEEYRLKGVVIHYGISEAGHYTSYIRTSSNQWKYFDDDRITPFDIKDLKTECFGGIEQNFYSDNTQKIKNAYLLIYQRSKLKQKENEKIDESIKRQVDQDNERNQEVKMLFEKGLLDFMNCNYLSLGKRYLSFVQLVVLRGEKRSKYLKEIYDNCVNLFEERNELIDWYLNQFSENIIREFLIYSHFEVSYFVASLISFCLPKTLNLQFIRRCIKCIEARHMIPLCKVIHAGVLGNQKYGKVLAEYNAPQKIVKLIKQNKLNVSAGISKINDVESEFGEVSRKFVDKNDYRDNIEMLEMIEDFSVNLTIADVAILSARARKLRVQVSLAKIVSRKFKDEGSLKKLYEQFIIPKLLKEEPRLDEQHIFNFTLILVRQIVSIEDALSKNRIKTMIKVYLDAIIMSLDGYKAMRYLIEALFNTCFTVPAFHKEFVGYLNAIKEGKKIIKAIKQWIKEGERFYITVKNDKMGYWRKPDPRYYVPREYLQQIQQDGTFSPLRYQSLLNSLLENHSINFQYMWSTNVEIGETVVLNYEENKIKVEAKFGYLLQISQNKFVPESDVTPVRSL